MLSETRSQIDQIDQDIVRLIEKRISVVRRVAEIKEQNRLPIFDSKREQDLVKKVRSYCELERTPDIVEVIFRELMTASKEEQRLYLAEDKI